jgi:predicted Zn-dependent peptidase
MLGLSTLSNGIQIISQYIPGIQSVALGIWLQHGSRHEAPHQAGYTHLLEHLLFQGTKQRSAIELATHFAAMGGQINAQTGRELTAIYGLVTADKADELFSLLLEVYLAPAFNEADVIHERQIVLQEMALSSDPEDAILAHIWPMNALARPITGYVKTLQNATAATLHDYWRENVQACRLSITAAGAVRHDDLLQRCTELVNFPNKAQVPKQQTPKFVPVSHQIENLSSITQVQLTWVFPAPPFTSPLLPTYIIANHILAGSTASRLYQALRLDMPLVYGVQGRLESYTDTGLWWLQTVVPVQHLAICRQRVETVWQTLAATGPTSAELACTLAHLQARVQLEADDSQASMERLAREGIYLGEIRTPANYLAQLESVRDIREIMQEAWKNRAYFEAY